jgi:coenzyme F420-reducing hydrogenase gamma subunit
MGKKLKIGWFSFSCCEDSTIMFAEMLNDHFEEWSKLLEFRHCRVLKSKNELSDIDVAFVEGAIASDKDSEELRKIRANSRKLVAIGSCAVTGMPSAQRNMFDEKLKQEIKPIVEHFKLNEKAVPLKEVVQVDDNVPGCPMNEQIFLQVVTKYLKEFGVA